MTNTPATEKQTAYIKSLILDAQIGHMRRANDLRSGGVDLSDHKHRHTARRVANAELMERICKTITIPSDLTQQEASTWIDALKRSTLIDMALDNPAVAARMGLAGIINEVGATKIEDALRGI